MLKTFFSNYKNYTIFNTGFLLDYSIKKTIELFIKHIFIYLGLFFAEKFIIEFLTKKNTEVILFALNKFHNFFTFSFSYFFFFTLFYFFFFLGLINIIIIFFM